MIAGHRSLVIGHRILWVFSVLILQVSFCGLRPLYAEPIIKSGELIEMAEYYDGKKVVYQGEVIFAPLRQGDHAWVNVNDDDNAIGIWCDKAQFGLINVAGDYKHRGDIITVEGVFHRACPVHGGELDIHADALTVVKPGFQIKEKTNKTSATLAIILFLITLSVAVIFRRRI